MYHVRKPTHNTCIMYGCIHITVEVVPVWALDRAASFGFVRPARKSVNDGGCTTVPSGLAGGTANT